MRVPVGLRSVLPLASTIALVALVGACSASAAEPWWQLSSGLRPSNLKAGLAADEVQELSVKGSGSFTLTLTTATADGFPTHGDNVVNLFVATEGTFRVGDEIPLAGSTVTAVGSESLTLSAAWSGPTFVQAIPKVFTAQETTAAIPVGATPAEVEAALAALPAVGQQGVEVTGSAGGPYSVTFRGGFSDLPVALMQAGGSAAVKVSELTHGRADGEIVLHAENLGDAVVNMEANPVTIADVLPPGLQAVSIVANEPGPEAGFNIVHGVPCTLASLTCTAS